MYEKDINMIESSRLLLEFNPVDLNENPIFAKLRFEILKKGKTFYSEEKEFPASFDLYFLPDGIYVYRVISEDKVLQCGRIRVFPIIKN